MADQLDSDKIISGFRSEVDETAGWAHDALNKMRRAHQRGTGCRLTADEVFALSLTRIGELWEEEDPRTTKGLK